MSVLRRFCACVVVLAMALPGCGGSGGNGNPSGGTPPPGGGTGNDPCAAALAGLPPAPAGVTSARAAKTTHALGEDVRDVREALWLHRGRTDGRLGAQDVRALRDEDVGDIAVLQDDGSLVLAANSFDLSGAGLRFTRNGAGGYDVTSIGGALRTPLGNPVTLEDDDTSRADLPFRFPFYGSGHTSLFVNSDGNITFEEGDEASTERGVGRLLAGPPRIATYFADLDPSAGGRVFLSAAASSVTVTWCSVRGFDSTNAVTTQATLLPDGAVEIRFGGNSLPAGITGLSPGRTDAFAPVDFRAAPLSAGPAALAERFAANSELDLVAAARRFLASHPDDFDQIAFWTDQGVVRSGTFAFQTTLNNQIRGIGKQVFDASREFGSGGRLQGLLVMDNLGKYPSDPAAQVVGEDSTLSVFAHEVGHRWGVDTRFRDGSGQVSEVLLGRQDAHWSFFFDSDASFLEGNEIEDLGGGQFRTAAPSQRYGPLDLYNMGLIGPGEVPRVFFVDAPTGTTRSRASDPRSNVTFGGTRREVTIDQVIQALGPRQPAANASPRLHRLAVVYVAGRGRSADAAALAKLERIRAAFVPFFEAGTGGRMGLETSLR